MVPHRKYTGQQKATGCDSGRHEASVQRFVTAERLGPYLAECGNDFRCAEALYVWNVRVSGAFYESLGIFEIVLRNALCEQLRAWHGKRGGSWLDDPRGVFEDNRIKQIDEAKRILAVRGKPTTEGRIMAAAVRLLAFPADSTLRAPTLDPSPAPCIPSHEAAAP